MKLAVQAENFVDWVARRFNLAPLPLIHTQVAASAARAIQAAAELGIFDAIGREQKRAEEIAEACGTHPAATVKLLDCLTGIGYLRWSKGRYALRRRLRKWLLSESAQSCHDKLIFQQFEWNYLSKLEDFVRSGEPIDLHRRSSPEEWACYQRAMRALSHSVAGEVGRTMPMPPGARQMLDIGGSHGLMSRALCEAHPQLRSTILELPGAAQSVRAMIEGFESLDGRISLRVGDALKDDLGEEAYDLVLICNVVHHFSEAQNRMLAQKVARALRPGGIYAINEFIRPELPSPGGWIGATSDLYFALTSASGTWTRKEIRAWQEDAGLKPYAHLDFLRMPGWESLIAQKVA